MMNYDVVEDSDASTLRGVIDDLQSRISDLENDLENMTEEKDIQYDRAETLSEEVETLEAQVRDLEGEVKTDEEIEVIESIRDLKISYERLGWGANHEIDNIIALTNKLLEFYL